MNITDIVNTVYTATLNGAPLRFYSPQSAADLMPWVSSADLTRALGMNRQARKAMLKANTKHPDLAKRIRTADGPVDVIAYQGVQGLMGALKDLGFATETTHYAFVQQVVDAAKRTSPALFDTDANGAMRIRSTAIAMLLGETHDAIVDRIHEEEIDAEKAPPPN
jgi:hypothetical protein